MNDPQAVLKIIETIRAKRAEQEVLLKNLEILAHVALQGVDVGQVSSLGFCANTITYEQLQALRREYRSIIAGDKRFLDWLADRFYNVVRLKNGESKTLSPFVARF